MFLFKKGSEYLILAGPGLIRLLHDLSLEYLEAEKLPNRGFVRDREDLFENLEQEMLNDEVTQGSMQSVEEQFRFHIKSLEPSLENRGASAIPLTDEKTILDLMAWLNTLYCWKAQRVEVLEDLEEEIEVEVLKTLLGELVYTADFIFSE